METTEHFNQRSTQENPQMMAFFDSMVQREIEGWDIDDDSGENVSTDNESAAAASDNGDAVSEGSVDEGMESHSTSIIYFIIIRSIPNFKNE